MMVLVVKYWERQILLRYVIILCQVMAIRWKYERDFVYFIVDFRYVWK